MELDLVVGAILRDITQARFLSDVHSRDLSRYYEQDPLLRRFPVPRADLDQIDLDLRFAVGTVVVVPGGGQGVETSTATVFPRNAMALAHRVFEELINATRDAADLSAESRETLTRLLRRETHRIDLQQVLLRYLERNQARLVRDGKLDRSVTAAEMTAQVLLFLRELRAGANLPDEDANRVFGRLEGGRLGFLDEQIDGMATEVEAAVAGRGDVKVQVEVTAGVLRDTPEQAISTLRIKSMVRNYRWSEVEGEGGRVWRKLAPE